MKIIVRSTANQNRREYLIEGRRICDLPYDELSRPIYGDWETRFARLGSVGKAIAAALMDPVHGNEIERITFHHESVCVYRAPTATWGHVEWEIILPVLKAAIGDPNAKVMQYEDFMAELFEKEQQKRRDLVHA